MGFNPNGLPLKLFDLHTTGRVRLIQSNFRTHKGSVIHWKITRDKLWSCAAIPPGISNFNKDTDTITAALRVLQTRP